MSFPQLSIRVFIYYYYYYYSHLLQTFTKKYRNLRYHYKLLGK